jgi:hypothetical protein
MKWTFQANPPTGTVDFSPLFQLILLKKSLCFWAKRKDLD